MSPTRNSAAVPLSEWQPITSGTAELDLGKPARAQLDALRMDFDFHGDKGFVVARRRFERPMPAEYALTFRLRGRGPVNDLELKLVDPSGLNVWRTVWRDFSLPQRWKRIRVESRDIEFAWGPGSGSAIAQLGSIEVAVVAGAGGRGTVWIAELRIEDLTPAQPPRARASSARAGFEADAALSGTGWRPRPDDSRPWISIDCAAPRMLGGVIIDWLGGAPASGFRVRASMRGQRWKTVHAARRAGGPRSYVYLPSLRTRFLRVELTEPSAGATVRLQNFEFSRSIDAFWYTVAAAEPRGALPRWLHREQSEWTPIGTSHGTECALMNGDGMVEVHRGSCSLEPMLLIGKRLFTWADMAARQTLAEDWMPVPSVIWETGDWRLIIQTQAASDGELRVRYRFENLTAGPLTARLFVVVRAFQVTPPWQHFRTLGGVSRITDLVWCQGVLRVNAATRIVPLDAAARFGALSFDEGFIASALGAGELPASSEAHEPFGFAQGAIEFDLGANAQAACERTVCAAAARAASDPSEAPACAASGAPMFDWGAQLPVNQWSGNGWITEAIRAALTATAHVLVTRSGPALQPGPRRYTRSWIRDGTMMSAALLRMGHADEVAELIRWYAPHQRADGFVPCCVDHEGTDWLVEHDSHGELIALIADHHRFAADARLLEQSWVFVERAVQCIEGLLGADGLLPISVSHEGYLAQPVHSYWDDFWALRGVRDAAYLAQALGKDGQSGRWQGLAARLEQSLFASIERTRAERGLDFIPGSVEWADFDPTATANAIYLFDLPEGLERGAVERTFEKYLADWRARRSGALPATSYTPYEIRIVGALVRLGWRDAALELLRFFLSDRRPRPWNQWPEIAWRDRTAPAHVGDLPHTWIGAEYVLALRSLFAYERESDRSLILAAGLAPEWIEGAGVRVNAMPTAYGNLSYSLRRVDAHTLRFELGGDIRAKLILRPPLAAPLRSASIDGVPAAVIDGASVSVEHTPAVVTCGV